MTHAKENSCRYCHIGRLHLRLVTYVHLYNGTLVSVPNTPAWECDYCHALEYDLESLQRINTLVGQAGPPPNRHQARAKPHTRRKSGIYPADS